jgi:hypothetical protein
MISLQKSTLSIVILVNLLLPIRTYCQLSSNLQKRVLNESLLQLIDNYEIYARFTSDNKRIDENYIAKFKDLFQEGASIFIDILPSNKISDKANITEYVDLLKKYYTKGVGIKISNILFSQPYYIGDGEYEINVSLDKEIYGYNNTNVNYKDIIPLIFNIGFKTTGATINQLRIKGISGSPRGRFLKFRIYKSFTKAPVRNAEIRLGSHVYKTDQNGFAVVEDIDPSKSHTLSIIKEPYKKIMFSGVNIDDYINSNTDKNHRRLKYDYYDPNEFIYFLNTLTFSVSPSFSFTIPGIKTIRSLEQTKDLGLYNLKESGNFSPRFGINLGLTLLHTSKFNISTHTGFEMNFINSSYSFDSCYVEQTLNDPINGQYSKKINLSDFQQRISLNFVEFPLLFSIKYKAFNKFDVNGNFGIRFGYLYKGTSDLESGYRSIDILGTVDTVMSKTFKDFIPEAGYFSYQLGLTISKEIRPNLRIYAGPTLLLYSKELSRNNNPVDCIVSDNGEINNIYNTYRKIRLQNIAFEIGLIYHFNSINLKKIL